MDPEQPVPGTGDGVTLAELPREAVDVLVDVAGAGSGSPLLSVEIRHLDGEFARPRPEHGALAAIDARYVMYAVGITPTPEAETRRRCARATPDAFDGALGGETPVPQPDRDAPR